MGSGGSKDATVTGARGARTVRTLRSRVLRRPACFRRPKVLLDGKCGDETNAAKDVGCSDIARKNRGGLDETRCLGFIRSRLPPQFDNSVLQNGDVHELSSTISLNSINNTASQSPASCASLHLHSCFGLPHNDTKFTLGRTASTSSNNNDCIPRCNSAPHVEMRNRLRQSFDSSSENVNDRLPKNIDRMALAADAASTNVDCEGEDTQQIPAINGSIERKLLQRRQEPLENTARFSRTLSVGRLRDRVLRRTSFPDGRYGFLFSEESSAYSRQDSRRRLLDALANISYADGERNVSQLALSSHQLSDNSNCESGRNFGPMASELREIGGHDSAEPSSTTTERRRIRSQVRALQRLGSRFENMSGHERPCILSGQHRTGNCVCLTNSRSRNPADQTSTRASISRIVMLAEALFEVLDEIHQQAVVLASRPSSASIGSVPAPKDVVDRMPVKTYKKSQKCHRDETSQCYICLVEYEEGDELRILPCVHEFHRSCVDKWLKEIHRVCPLCRYDVCLSDASRINGLD